MSTWTKFRNRIRDLLREKFPWYVQFDPPKNVPTPEPPAPPVPQPEPPPGQPVPGFFITDGNVAIPTQYINSQSDDPLWKPISEGKTESVILLPAKHVGNVEKVSVNKVPFYRTTRDYDIVDPRTGNVTSAKWPNGARDHWRTNPPMKTGEGAVLVTLNDGTILLSENLTLSKKQGFHLPSVSGGTTPTPEPPQPEPPGPSVPTFDGHTLILPGWMTARAANAYATRLGHEPLKKLGSGTTFEVGGGWNIIQVKGTNMSVLVDLYLGGDGYYRIHAVYSLNGAWPYPFERGTKFGAESEGWQKYLQ